MFSVENKRIKDILKALDEEQQTTTLYEVMFLIFKSIYILKVYSIHNTFR